MPFVRFSRDRRGYEHTYLIHSGSRKGAPTKILYWYRTPPGVKVGRVAFDDVVRRTLEAQFPGVMFDWQTLADTPIPPVEVEHWRERRRSERAAKQARLAAARDDQTEVSQVAELEEPIGDIDLPQVEALTALAAEAVGDEEPDPAGSGDPAEDLQRAATATSVATTQVPLRRRRRRGGRGRRRGSETPDVPPKASDS